MVAVTLSLKVAKLLVVGVGGVEVKSRLGIQRSDWRVGVLS